MQAVFSAMAKVRQPGTARISNLGLIDYFKCCSIHEDIQLSIHFHLIMGF